MASTGRWRAKQSLLHSMLLLTCLAARVALVQSQTADTSPRATAVLAQHVPMAVHMDPVSAAEAKQHLGRARYKPHTLHSHGSKRHHKQGLGRTHDANSLSWLDEMYQMADQIEKTATVYSGEVAGASPEAFWDTQQLGSTGNDALPIVPAPVPAPVPVPVSEQYAKEEPGTAADTPDPPQPAKKPRTKQHRKEAKAGLTKTRPAANSGQQQANSQQVLAGQPTAGPQTPNKQPKLLQQQQQLLTVQVPPAMAGVRQVVKGLSTPAQPVQQPAEEYEVVYIEEYEELEEEEEEVEQQQQQQQQAVPPDAVPSRSQTKALPHMDSTIKAPHHNNSSSSSSSSSSSKGTLSKTRSTRVMSTDSVPQKRPVANDAPLPATQPSAPAPAAVPAPAPAPAPLDKPALGNMGSAFVMLPYINVAPGPSSAPVPPPAAAGSPVSQAPRQNLPDPRQAASSTPALAPAPAPAPVVVRSPTPLLHPGAQLIPGTGPEPRYTVLVPKTEPLQPAPGWQNVQNVPQDSQEKHRTLVGYGYTRPVYGYSTRGYGYTQPPSSADSKGQQDAAKPPPTLDSAAPGIPGTPVAQPGPGDKSKAGAGPADKPGNATGNGQQQQKPAPGGTGGFEEEEVIDGEQLPLPPPQDRRFGDDWYGGPPSDAAAGDAPSPSLGGWPTTPKEPAEPEVPTASGCKPSTLPTDVVGDALVIEDSTTPTGKALKAAADCMLEGYNTYQFGGDCELFCTEAADYSLVQMVRLSIKTGGAGQTVCGALRHNTKANMTGICSIIPVANCCEPAVPVGTSRTRGRRTAKVTPTG